MAILDRIVKEGFSWRLYLSRDFIKKARELFKYLREHKAKAVVLSQTSLACSIKEKNLLWLEWGKQSKE